MSRSNVRDWIPEELWRAYIQLTEAEAAFRIQKSDLQILPVWHQRADRRLKFYGLDPQVSGSVP